MLQVLEISVPLVPTDKALTFKLANDNHFSNVALGNAQNDMLFMIIWIIRELKTV